MNSQEAVFRFLADPETQKLSEPVERVDTANAVVFLTGADVYKLKRAVKFPFMDLSRLDKRREACEAEIAVNRPVAPDMLDATFAAAAERSAAAGLAAEAGVPFTGLFLDAPLDRRLERIASQ